MAPSHGGSVFPIYSPRLVVPPGFGGHLLSLGFPIGLGVVVCVIKKDLMFGSSLTREQGSTLLSAPPSPVQ